MPLEARQRYQLDARAGGFHLFAKPAESEGGGRSYVKERWFFSAADTVQLNYGSV